jgi:hypothetical protein
MAEKKTAKGGTATPKDSEKDALAKELCSLIPKLDAEGLRFLVEQANVHLYNMQVDILNQRVVDGADAQKSGKGKSSGAAKTVKSKAADEPRLEGSESGSSFYLVFRGQWLMFSREEIAQMVQIVSAPVTELERLEHLFTWLERERRDLFAAIPIADKFDERLKKIAALLKKNFKVKS